MFSMSKSWKILPGILTMLLFLSIGERESRAFERSIPWPTRTRDFENIGGYSLPGVIAETDIISEAEILWRFPDDDSKPVLLIRLVASIENLPDQIISGRVAPLAGLIRIQLPPETTVNAFESELLCWNGTSWGPVTNAVLDPEVETALAQTIGSSILRSGGMLNLDAYTITSSYALNLSPDLSLVEPALSITGQKNPAYTQSVEFYWLDPADSEGNPLINRTSPSASTVREVPIELAITFDEIQSCELNIYIGFVEAVCLEGSPGPRGRQDNTTIYNYRSWSDSLEIFVPEPEPEITDLEAELAEEPCPLLPEGMVLIPTGVYMIGAADEDPMAGSMERPAHQVELQAFYMDIFPVTNRQFWDFASQTNYQTDSDWMRYYTPGTENYPIRGVNFYDAAAYANWCGKRIPTEEEWEAAARGFEGNIYPWGNEFRPEFVALDDFTPIDAHPGNISPFGVREMCGNVLEWTSSQLLPYPGNTYPNVPECLVLRGGAATNPRAILFRSTTRPACQPYVGLHTFGFRCVMDFDAFIPGGIEEAVPEPVEEPSVDEGTPTTLIGGEGGVVEFSKPDDDEDSGSDVSGESNQPPQEGEHPDKPHRESQ